jgi:hypothetical protein
MPVGSDTQFSSIDSALLNLSAMAPRVMQKNADRIHMELEPQTEVWIKIPNEPILSAWSF